MSKIIITSTQQEIQLDIQLDTQLNTNTQQDTQLGTQVEPSEEESGDRTISAILFIKWLKYLFKTTTSCAISFKSGKLLLDLI